MQAIVTKYIGPSRIKGSRVKAKCQARAIVLDWDEGLNDDANHTAAAKALASKMGWDGKWVGGSTPDGYRCYVRVAGLKEDSFIV